MHELQTKQKVGCSENFKELKSSVCKEITSSMLNLIKENLPDAVKSVFSTPGKHAETLHETYADIVKTRKSAMVNEALKRHHLLLLKRQ